MNKLTKPIKLRGQIISQLDAELRFAKQLAYEVGAKVTDIAGKPIKRWDKSITGLRPQRSASIPSIGTPISPVLVMYDNS